MSNYYDWQLKQSHSKFTDHIAEYINPAKDAQGVTLGDSKPMRGEKFYLTFNAKKIGR
jgi:hypothetical protein